MSENNLDPLGWGLLGVLGAWFVKMLRESRLTIKPDASEFEKNIADDIEAMGDKFNELNTRVQVNEKVTEGLARDLRDLTKELRRQREEGR